MANQFLKAKSIITLSLILIAAMYIHVDIFLLFGLIITRNAKVFPTRPMGTKIGNQYLFSSLAMVYIIKDSTSSLKDRVCGEYTSVEKFPELFCDSGASILNVFLVEYFF